MSILRNALKPLFGRSVSTTKALYHPRSLVKLKKLQAEFQCEDGRPIFLKAGFLDRVLYSSTIVGCFAGVFMVLSTIYDNAKPPAWKGSTC